MTPFFDMFPVDADEYIVRVVHKNGCQWVEYAKFPTRLEACEFFDGMNKDDFRVIGIQPQNSDMYPFQTHPMQIVYEER